MNSVKQIVENNSQLTFLNLRGIYDTLLRFYHADFGLWSSRFILIKRHVFALFADKNEGFYADC